MKRINNIIFSTDVEKEKKEVISKFTSIAEQAIELYNRVWSQLIEFNQNLINELKYPFSYLYGYLNEWTVKISAISNSMIPHDIKLHMTIPILIPEQRILSFRIYPNDYIPLSKLTVTSNNNVYIRLDNVLIDPPFFIGDEKIEYIELYFFYINHKPSLQFQPYLRSKELKNLFIKIINRSSVFRVIEKKLSLL
jgi:hypothetical protein